MFSLQASYCLCCSSLQSFLYCGDQKWMQYFKCGSLMHFGHISFIYLCLKYQHTSINLELATENILCWPCSAQHIIYMYLYMVKIVKIMTMMLQSIFKNRNNFDYTITVAILTVLTALCRHAYKIPAQGKTTNLGQYLCIILKIYMAFWMSLKE